MLGPITLSLVGHRWLPIMPEILHVLVLGKVKGQGRNRKEAIMKVMLFKLESQVVLQTVLEGQRNGLK